jgi:hypothetical protein
VVTNYHVIQVAGATEAEIRCTDGASYRVESVLAVDPDRDLAIVKPKVAGKEFPYLRLGDSEQVQVGDSVVAIGSPLAILEKLTGLSTEATVSNGIVSGLRDWPEHGMRVFQITAPISPGSSGGALLNLKGEVIGVTFAQLANGQNLNFAVPSIYVAKLVSTPSSEARPFPVGAEKQKAITPSPPAGSPADILRAAKTVCILVMAGSPVLKSEFSEKLLDWGKLSLVSSPESADLIVEITQTGALNMGTGSGNQATALLRDRSSGEELWSKTKGGSWSMSGYSNAWVARALAKEFIKFFDHTTKAPRK